MSSQPMIPMRQAWAPNIGAHCSEIEKGPLFLGLCRRRRESWRLPWAVELCRGRALLVGGKWQHVWIGKQRKQRPVVAEDHLGEGLAIAAIPEMAPTEGEDPD